MTNLTITRQIKEQQHTEKKHYQGNMHTKRECMQDHANMHAKVHEYLMECACKPGQRRSPTF